MTVERPLVTAVIPAYNAERFLRQAIESVLSQDYPHAECVVVDDGSTDGTGEIAEQFAEREPDRVRCVRTSNRGVARARNSALDVADGEYVAFLDADDVWLPQKLSRQVAVFHERPHLGMVYTSLHLIDADGRFVGHMRAAAPHVGLRNTLLLERPIIALQTALIPRSVLTSVGFFDERLSTSADFDLVCRIARRHPLEVVDAPLSMWRLHGSGMHHDPEATEHDMRIAFDKVFGSADLPADLARLRRRAWSNLYISLAGSHLHRGDRRQFLRYAAKAASTRPDRLAAAFQRLTRPGGPEGLPTDS